MIGCDPITDIEIDKSYSLKTSCGVIDFTGIKFQTKTLLLAQKFIGGSYQVDLDELSHHIIPPDQNEVLTMKLKKDGFDLDKRAMLVQDEEVDIEIVFKERIDKGDVIFVLPCDYIKCQSQPLIADTIRINI